MTVEDGQSNMEVFLKFEIKSALSNYQEFLKHLCKYRQMTSSMAEVTAGFGKALEELANCTKDANNGKL